MAGIHNKRPPKPRLLFIWDVEVVVRYIKNLPHNEALTDKLLTLKLTILLSLAAASRVSELTYFNKTLIVRHHSVYVCHLAKLSKVCRPGKIRPPIKLKKFLDDDKLDVCKTLDDYVTRQRHWGTKEDSLLVSYIRPHEGVTPATVSRWVTNILSLAGIDTSKFCAHSTRAASTTKALNSGVSIADIMAQAYWSGESTFQRFYHKEIDDGSEAFQKAVLGL